MSTDQSVADLESAHAEFERASRILKSHVEWCHRCKPDIRTKPCIKGLVRYAQTLAAAKKLTALTKEDEGEATQDTGASTD